MHLSISRRRNINTHQQQGDCFCAKAAVRNSPQKHRRSRNIKQIKHERNQNDRREDKEKKEKKKKDKFNKLHLLVKHMIIVALLDNNNTVADAPGKDCKRFFNIETTALAD
eukprot:302050-Ditylum_brightwellii.AAC.1